MKGLETGLKGVFGHPLKQNADEVMGKFRQTLPSSSPAAGTVVIPSGGAPPAKAGTFERRRQDLVVMKNGDRKTGEVVRFDDQNVYLSPYTSSTQVLRKSKILRMEFDTK